ncbi:MAG: TrkA family potassium uptake protein [Chloroflexi bacterium]|nr:TrkA family potassium uptake protein [Chloroflexota bacterium]
MNFIVVGCGRLGAELAYRLFQQGHHLVVMDQTDAAFANLPSAFRGRTLPGDALNRGMLERAGIETADGLAAVTSSDAANAVIAHTARTVYKVPRLVVRNYDTRFHPIYDAFGLQVISTVEWGAQRLEELLYHADLRTVFSAGNGEVEVYELTAPASWQGQALKDVCSLTVSVPVALTRNGRAIIPSPETLIHAGDVLQVSATLEGAKLIRQKLG